MMPALSSERAEADAAELIAKKKLQEAKEAKRFGRPGAERKMQAAAEYQKEAAREQEEAVAAEALVVGGRLSDAKNRLSAAERSMQEARSEATRNQNIAGSCALYMLAQENNPHMVVGKGFRRALRGYDAAGAKMGHFLTHLKETGTFVRPQRKSEEQLRSEEEERVALEKERLEDEVISQILALRFV